MSMIPITDRVQTAIELGESHFREFKSALEGPPPNKTKRPPKEVATDIAQTLVAFANADGGELLVGVEDDGTLTGLPSLTPRELQLLEDAPIARVHAETPLPTVRRQRVRIGDKDVLYFSVPKSAAYVHATSDGRCLQRRDLQTLPVLAATVEFDRQEKKSREYDREFVDGVSTEDLNLDLVRAVADQVMKRMSPEKCLQYLDLGEYGLSHLKLRRAALLLFSKQPQKWHPRNQIRILRVNGDAVRTGEDYNVVSDEVIFDNIIALVDRAWEALRPHLVHTRFEKSARFEQKSMYPEHACREALLNAIAHRDYSEEGRGIEVFIFNSRLEVRNPGSLLSSIRLEDIVNLKGVHQSRNVHVARVLRELGYMRELGEGMRRIYELMHKNELAPPKLQSTTGEFTITLTHSPIYSEKDLLWLSQFDQFSLDREQKAVVLLGQDERIFSPKDVWDAVGIVDTEHYRKLVASLIDLGIFKNRVEKKRAWALARAKRIPFREYPRLGIEVPGQVLANTAVSVTADNPDPADVRDEVKRLFLGNLPPGLSTELLYDLLARFGDIAEMSIRNGAGFGFVEYVKAEEAAAALAAASLEFEGRKVVIRRAVAKRPRRAHRQRSMRQDLA